MPTPDEIRQEFLLTLRDPRYTTPENDPAQPFVLTGTLNGADTIFYASPTDLHDYGRETHQRVVEGKFGPIGDYEPPPPSSKRGR